LTARAHSGQRAARSRTVGATVAAIFGDPVVMRYWSTSAWTTSAQATAFIDRDLKAMRSGEYIRLGLERLTEPGLIGTCTLFNLASARSLARLGFRKEGQLRERWIVAGEVSDSGLYGLLASGWAARQIIVGTGVNQPEQQAQGVLPSRTVEP
jgi:RimJ/RimL family protein N-acetyltransferase